MTIDTMTIAKQAAEAVFQSIERHGGIVMDHVVTAIHDKLAGALAVGTARTEPYKAMIKRGDVTVDDLVRLKAREGYLKDAIQGVRFDDMIADDPLAIHGLKAATALAIQNDMKRREREFIQKMMGGGIPKGAVDSVVDFMKRNHVTVHPHGVAAAIKVLERSADGNVPTDHDPGDRRDRP